MVDTISPVVHGGRTPRYWLNVMLHSLGAVLGATLIGFTLGALGAVLGAPWGGVGTGLVVLAGLVYAARDLFAARVPLPDLKRQVPEWWRTFFSQPVTSLLYGLGLGIAFFTSLSFGTFVVVSVAAIATGDPILGGLIAAPFGLGRVLVVAAANPELLDDPSGQRFLGRANGLASALLGLAAALSLVA